MTNNRIVSLAIASIATFAAAWTPAWADILVFQSSDNHSEYSEIPNFVKSTSALAEQFRETNPKDPILHLINGDLAGPSQWTDFDRGALNYFLFEQLSNHYQVIMNLGNHEAFDYEGETGNSLFREQLLEFKKRTGAAMRNANVVPGAEGKDLFESHHDMISPSGKRIRIVGMVLNDLFSYSTYSHTAKTQIIAQVKPMLEEAKVQLQKAATENVDTVIFQCHEAFELTKVMLEQLVAWKATQPGLAKVLMPTVFAAHDHEVHQGKIGETMLIDSGTAFEFSKVVLDDDGRVKSLEHYNAAKQKAFEANDKLLPGEQLALTATKEMLSKVGELNGKVIVTPIKEFTETRKELKMGRYTLGLKLADTMVDWAVDSIKASPGVEVAGVLSFYNSGTYRGKSTIPAGDLTLGMLKMMYPFAGKPSLYILSGATIQEMFTTLREYGIKEKQYTPQIASHMREDAEHRLFIRDGNGLWNPIDLKANYALALDPWLGQNGFKVQSPAWDFTGVKTINAPISEQIAIFVKYLPRHLTTNDPSICELLLKGEI